MTCACPYTVHWPFSPAQCENHDGTAAAAVLRLGVCARMLQSEQRKTKRQAKKEVRFEVIYEP